VEWLAEDHVALWNFDVGSSGLKAEHIDGLRRIVGLAHLNGPGYAGTFVIAGHASTSGGAGENQRLSTSRAEQVAAWLRSFGFPNIITDGQGELDLGSGGEATARARRVEVVRSDPVIEPVAIPVPPPVAPPAPQSPGPQPPASPVPNPRVGISFDSWFPDPPIATQYVIFQYGLQGVARIVGSLPESAGTASMTYRAGRQAASIDYQARITESLRLKLGVDTPGQTNPQWMARVGLQWADLFVLDNVRISAEAGVSMNDRLLPGYFALNFEMPLDVDPLGLRFQVVGALRVRFAPSPALVARFLPAAAAAAGPILVAAAVVAWGIATTTLLAESVEWAREAGVERVRTWARRDGLAIRVAQELVGTDAASGIRDRLNAYPRSGPDPSATAILEGYMLAAHEFAALRTAGRYDARVGELRARYAADDPSFEGIRQAIFAAAGGYGNEGPPVLELGQL
jgi:hypothetical protein